MWPNKKKKLSNSNERMRNLPKKKVYMGLEPTYYRLWK